MNSMRLVNGKMLRRGYTTGSCAAAAAKASTIMLMTQTLCNNVTLITPNKTTLTLDVINAEYNELQASCAIQKDSGDDPDVTNGAFIYANVTLTKHGIEIIGGKGVGLVTKPGLDQPVGVHAINSVPRRMIYAECEAICMEYGYKGGLSIVISIPDGEKLAERTFNPKMGIKGGVSILGTTGIVEPMSEAAIVETIRAELSMLYKAGHRDILLTIGNYGEMFARDKLYLSMETHVMCSNHIGETLLMAAEMGFKNAMLVGHIGKLVKLGIGITNTHSNKGDGRIETLIACALTAGADIVLLHKIRECVSIDAAMDYLAEAGLINETMSLLTERIEDTLNRCVASHLKVGFICFSGIGEKAQLCAENDMAYKMRELFSL